MLPLFHPALLLATLTAASAATTAATTAGPVPGSDVSFSTLDRWDLVRVDQADMPDALTTSSSGSVLSTPPSTGAWHTEELAYTDGSDSLVGMGSWVADDAADALGVTTWQQAGLDGSRGGDPIKVAIFDVQWTGASLLSDELGDVQTHDCWAHPSCSPPIDDLRPRYSWELGSHGVACAEVVADLAPGVELHLVLVSSVTTLENAVDWAITQGIDVVTMSMSFFNTSFYDGTGPVAELMDRLTAGGVLMVTSAGNYADQHWQGAYRDDDGDGVHEFSPDRHTLPIYLSRGSHRFQVLWDDFDDCGHTDLDAYVYSGDGTLIGRSERRQTAGSGCDPTERVRVWAEEDGWTYLELRLAAGSPDVDIDVMARSGKVWQSIAAGSVTDPGTHPAVLTVGAVQADGYATNDAEWFSSQGPTHGGDAKPDLAGPDGITTQTFGPAAFYGTSAASPAVAATVALLMSAEPGLSAIDAAQRLRGHTLRDSTTWQGADPALGAGRVRLAPPDISTAHGCAGSSTRSVPLILFPALFPVLLRRRRRGRCPEGSSGRRRPPHGAQP